MHPVGAPNSLAFTVLHPLWPSYISHGSQLRSRSCDLSIPVHVPAILLPQLSAFLRTFSQLDPKMSCAHDVNMRVHLLLPRPAA